MIPDPTDGIRKLSAAIIIAAVRDLDRDLTVWKQSRHHGVRQDICDHIDFLQCRGRSKQIALFWLGVNDIPPLTSAQIGRLLHLERRKLLVLEDGL